MQTTSRGKGKQFVVEILGATHIIEYCDPQVLSLTLPYGVDDTDREGKGVRGLTQGNPYRSLSTLPAPASCGAVSCGRRAAASASIFNSNLVLKLLSSAIFFSIFLISISMSDISS